jgi:hypothetical protein
MVVGGIGRNLCKETENRALTEVEIYEPGANYWRFGGNLSVGRVNPVVFYDARIDKVVVSGGTDLVGNPINLTELYDPKITKWSHAHKGMRAHGQSEVVGNYVQTKDGPIVALGSTAKAFLSGAVRRSVSSGGSVNYTYKVKAISEDGYTITVDRNPLGEFGICHGGIIYPMTAQPNPDWNGPFLLDPVSGLAMTEKSVILDQDIGKGLQYSSLKFKGEDLLPPPIVFDDPGGGMGFPLWGHPPDHARQVNPLFQTNLVG